MADVQSQRQVTRQIKARVAVDLINGDGEQYADVYGTIAARVDSGPEITFYDRSRRDAELVSPGTPITLNNDILMSTSAERFTVRANLMDRDNDPSRDDEIANGSATFIVRGDGSSAAERIKGRNGEIEVRILWFNVD
ncbi:hypothetical protein BVRB_8g185750 [Beta vulgaris subsp. vulgaris]|uniref:uncharacterized protein LOC104900961 n=1 Tax=Beta vulgaris subsp. vulgaris TaxID=3555 RepID=UPI00053F8AA8|nr:uncharacterized protein LOC104900961 [Beta vulgaris subsp. vulgaris]KMT04125.1 hypothetical protein BVRB_8g185750 [Beta vulgaris subsp. vulgaris]